VAKGARRDVKLSNVNVVPNSLDTAGQSMFMSNCRRSDKEDSLTSGGFNSDVKPVARAE